MGLNLLSRTSRDQQGTGGRGSERNPLRYTSRAFLLALGRKAKFRQDLAAVAEEGEEVAQRSGGGRTSSPEEETSLKSGDIKARFLDIPACPSPSDGSVCPGSRQRSGVFRSCSVSIAKDMKCM